VDEPARLPAKPSATAPPVLAVNARTLSGDFDKAREREVRLVIGADRLTMHAAGSDDLLQTVPYAALLSISYSKGRDPQWQSPGGPATVLRAEGGALGIFRGERHWLSLRMLERFVVVRVEGRDVDRVIAALEARTGRSVERVASR
jgi:hypothetical protein